MKPIELFDSFYFRNEVEGWDAKDLRGQWQDGITNRIPSKGALFELLSWNNAVTFGGQHKLGLCLIRSRMLQKLDWMFAPRSGR